MYIGTLVWRRNNVYICVNGVNVICDISEGLCLTDMIRLGEREKQTLSETSTSPISAFKLKKIFR